MSILTSPYPTSDQGSVSLEPVFASEIVNVSEKLLLSGYCSGYSVAIVGLNHKEGHVHLLTLFCARVTVATQWPHSGHTVATQWPHSGHW